MPTPFTPAATPDVQLDCYRAMPPVRFAQVTDLIDLSRDLSAKAHARAVRRSGFPSCNCDEGRPCREHRAAHRLLSIVESRGGR
jgi:hypothetical protein